ncbi:hypothetical protein KJZ71_05540 [Patescibacteria group bacterium]|uniref:Uncharacterized protein n=1 Tax=candidate division WWE3 bacterium TaxID=2053526 RepID=A0A928TSG5_UNCKA|nr:hypothetical protein [candidate division WWE3 bacterium]MCL4733231.1 hypothetical protein [Patescibacteria group bacterium]MDL1953307.1 hypothetical protein [Candidatus Uhrbacteria bacterium UHB]RIL00536.1 MAG: hypothetical protein DCC77_03175 [Candidatus Uhrbacteria bacterium]
MKKIANRPYLAVIVVAGLTILGVGCRQESKSAILEEGGRQNIKAPSSAWKEYGRANSIEHAIVRVYLDTEAGKQMSLRIPDAWTGSGPVWRPSKDDSINHIRVQYFANTGPEGEFRRQKDSDIHDVVYADAGDTRYLLLVNHPVLKASILKMFVPDPENPGKAFYFAECRVGFDADRSFMWNACKTAIDSLDLRSVDASEYPPDISPIP